SVQGVPSTTVAPMHAPWTQTSPTVHELRSVQRAPSATPLQLLTSRVTGPGPNFAPSAARAERARPSTPHRTAVAARPLRIQAGGRIDDRFSGTARSQHLRFGAVREIGGPFACCSRPS